jgi:hypothetical protein
MTFAEALEIMLRGGKVHRTGWVNSDLVIGFSFNGDLVGALSCEIDNFDEQLLDKEDYTATDWEEVTR